MSIIFGPVPSRRFGISLGIDLSPSLKQCNFDCLYCELKATKTISTYSEIISVDEIIYAVNHALIKYPKIDVLTVTANGEPTLYPYLKELIIKLNTLPTNAKKLILSNGSTIYKDNVQDALMEFDIVKLSLDCISEKCFKKLDRANKSIQTNLIVPAMIEFRKKFANEMVIEVLFVKNINDNDIEIEQLHTTLLQIQPNRVDIGTIDRPPAYNVKPIDYDKLIAIANKFSDLNVNVTYKKRPKYELSFDEKEISNLLSRRPLTEEDIENTFNNESKKILNQLIKSNKIHLHNISGINFYKIR